MHTTGKDDAKAPVPAPMGEITYEMTGIPSGPCATKSHSLALIVLPPGKSSLRHYHHVSEETCYILHGAARLVIDGSEFRLRPGQACLIEPQERHQIFNDGPDTLEFVTISAPPWTPNDSIFI
jgi:mannose-6-phosphate isomerase-like protein (cupin superfamily)